MRPSPSSPPWPEAERPAGSGRRLPRSLIATSLAACVALAACGDPQDAVPTSGAARPPVTSVPDAGPGSASTTTAPAPATGLVTEDALGDVDVWTSLGQSRHLEGTNRVVVPIRFDDDEPVAVSSIAVRSPWFDPLPPEPKQSLLHPGRTVHVQVDLGRARCGMAVPADATATVELVASVAGSVPTLLVLPLPTGLLERLHGRACTLEDLAGAVSVGFAPEGTVTGADVATEIVVGRRGSDEPIALDRIAGSVILALEPVEARQPLAELRPGAHEARVPVRVVASRCDPHGLSGSQKTFVFPVWVSVGGGDPVYLELRPGPDLERAMRRAISACVAAQ